MGEQVLQYISASKYTRKNTFLTHMIVHVGPRIFVILTIRVQAIKLYSRRVTVDEIDVRLLKLTQ